MPIELAILVFLFGLILFVALAYDGIRNLFELFNRLGMIAFRCLKCRRDEQFVALQSQTQVLGLYLIEQLRGPLRVRL